MSSSQTMDVEEAPSCLVIHKWGIPHMVDGLPLVGFGGTGFIRLLKSPTILFEKWVWTVRDDVFPSFVWLVERSADWPIRVSGVAISLLCLWGLHVSRFCWMTLYLEQQLAGWHQGSVSLLLHLVYPCLICPRPKPVLTVCYSDSLEGGQCC